MNNRSFPQSLSVVLLLLVTAFVVTAQQSLPELVKKVKPAVVSIITYDSDGEPLMTGSGFFIDPHQVVTNLLGPIRLTNALIDHLTVQPNAAIVNVSSGLAFVPLSSAPTYSATKAAVHSYAVSLREQLRGRVEVIELVPPAVQTALTPGQATRQGYVPLGQYIDEVMGLFQQQPTAKEILVERVGFLRWAERDGRFDDAVKMLSAH